MRVLVLVWVLTLLAQAPLPSEEAAPSAPVAHQGPLTALLRRCDALQAEAEALARVEDPGQAAEGTAAEAGRPGAGLHVEGAGEDDEDDAPAVAEDVPELSEAEAPGQAAAPGTPDNQYTQDLTDEALAATWREAPQTLGSISVGFAEAGRLINAVQLPPGDAWTVVTPENAWGAQETIDALVRVARAVKERFPRASPLRVNHISKRSGGYLRPHSTHQSGRDVDVGFYYPPSVDPAAPRQKRELAMDAPVNWAFLKALVTLSDVQVVLLDRRVQAVLLAQARAEGEDEAWLQSLFGGGRAALVQHARRHRDHFHVRFYAPRSQELGRRLQPLFVARPDENLAHHRVKRGDTLGHIAMKYGSTVVSIRKANGLKNNLLRVGRTLMVPLRGPCTTCPVPPVLVVPPRRLPPPRPQA